MSAEEQMVIGIPVKSELFELNAFVNVVARLELGLLIETIFDAWRFPVIFHGLLLDFVNGDAPGEVMLADIVLVAEVDVLDGDVEVVDDSSDEFLHIA